MVLTRDGTEDAGGQRSAAARLDADRSVVVHARGEYRPRRAA